GNAIAKGLWNLANLALEFASGVMCRRLTCLGAAGSVVGLGLKLHRPKARALGALALAAAVVMVSASMALAWPASHVPTPRERPLPLADAASQLAPDQSQTHRLPEPFDATTADANDIDSLITQPIDTWSPVETEAASFAGTLTHRAL